MLLPLMAAMIPGGDIEDDWDDETASDQGNDGSDSGDSANESGPY